MACADALITVVGSNSIERHIFVNDSSAEKLCRLAGDNSTNDDLILRCCDTLCVAAYMYYNDDEKGLSPQFTCTFAFDTCFVPAYCPITWQQWDELMCIFALQML